MAGLIERESAALLAAGAGADYTRLVRTTSVSGRAARAGIVLAFGWVLLSGALPSQVAAQASGLGSPAPAGAVVVPDEARRPTQGAEPRGSLPPGETAAGVREAGEVAPGDPATLVVPPPPPQGGGVYGGPVYPGAGGSFRQLGPEPESSGVRIPSETQTRLRALDQAFNVMVARGGGGVVEGVLGILTGGLSITLGILFDNAISPYLYTLGATGAARGILSLALMLNPSGPAINFAAMPMGSIEEVQARLEYGERELAAMADQARIARILDASLNIAGGLAIIPAYLGPQNFEIINDFDWFVLIAAGVSSVSGVITLFTTTEAERRWSIYEELRDRLQAADQDLDDDQAAVQARSLTEVGGSVTPVAGGVAGSGAMFGASGTF